MLNYTGLKVFSIPYCKKMQNHFEDIFMVDFLTSVELDLQYLQCLSSLYVSEQPYTTNGEGLVPTQSR